MFVFRGGLAHCFKAPQLPIYSAIRTWYLGLLIEMLTRWIRWTGQRIRTKLLTVSCEFLSNTTKYTHYRSEEDAIYDILIRDRTLKDVLAFTGDRTERGGEMSTIHKHLWPPLTSRPSS